MLSIDDNRIKKRVVRVDDNFVSFFPRFLVLRFHSLKDRRVVRLLEISLHIFREINASMNRSKSNRGLISIDFIGEGN